MRDKAEKTVIALYDRFEDAKAAVNDLAAAGVAKDRVAVLANNVDGTHHPGLLSNPAYAREEMETGESDATSGMGIGAEIGAGLGGLLGYLIGVGTLAIPGIGPVIALGAWVTVAAGIVGGGVVGGAVGALTEKGVSREDTHLYSEGLRRGGTLVTVHAADDQVEQMIAVFKAHGAVDVEQRKAAWQAEGWVSFDPEGQPLSAGEIASIRRQADGDGRDHHHEATHFFKPESAGPERLAGVSSETTRYAEDKAGL